MVSVRTNIVEITFIKYKKKRVKGLVYQIRGSTGSVVVYLYRFIEEKFVVCYKSKVVNLTVYNPCDMIMFSWFTYLGIF